MSDSELTRFADAAWAPLVRGQRITVTHGDFSGDYRVVDITPGHDGSETYHLKPAAEVDALVNRAADLVMDELAARQASDAIEREIAPYDLLAEPKAYVFLQPGWGERLKELAPRNDQIVGYDAVPPGQPQEPPWVPMRDIIPRTQP